MSSHNNRIDIGTLTFVTWNVNGLGSQVKRGKVFSYLKTLSADIVFLQETHIKASEQNRLKVNWFSDIYQSTFSSKARGVAILFRKNVPFQLSSLTSDPNGRYLIVSGKINNIPITCVNVYGPNTDDPEFFRRVFNLLPDPNSTNLIMGGDYNVFLDSYLDRLSTRPSPPSKASCTMNNLINSFNLVDIWRIQHPTDKDYSFFSHAHKSYTRIDFFSLTQS